MSRFNSIKELLNTMSRGNKLIAEMFEISIFLFCIKLRKQCL